MKTPYLKFLSALLLISFTGILAGLTHLKSYQTLLLSLYLGAMTVIVVIVATFRKQDFSVYKQKQSFVLLILSGIAMGLFLVFLFKSYRLVGVGSASISCYCGPGLLLIVSPLLYRERPSKANIIGFILILIGAVLMMVHAFSIQNFRGVYLGMFAGVLYALSSVLADYSGATGGQVPLIKTIAALLTTGVYVVVKYNLGIHPSGYQWIPIIILGVGCFGAGLYMHSTSIYELPLETTSMIEYGVPILAMLLGAVILKEHLYFFELLACALVAAGGFVGWSGINLIKNRPEKKSLPEPETVPSPESEE